MTAAFFRSFNRVALAAGLVLGVGSCVDDKPLDVVTSSFDIEITSPTALGTMDKPLASLPMATVTVQAMDSNGKPDNTFNKTIAASIHYLGSLTALGQNINVVNGKATATLTLPVAYGEVYLWVDDTTGDNPTYATGTSQEIWFRNPYVEDTETPNLNDPSTWLVSDQLENKQATIDTSAYGANGALIATGVYTDGFALDDVDCSVTPCVAHDFNHVYVYTFSRAVDANGQDIVPGDIVQWVSGGVGEFDGFTELNFPEVGVIVSQTPSKLPLPAVIQPGWLISETDPRGMINLEKLESGLAEVDNVKFCTLDDDYTNYSQWKVDVGNGCFIPMNIITSDAVPLFDPTTQLTPGQAIQKIVGVVRAVNLPGFDVWILYPRSMSDITL